MTISDNFVDRVNWSIYDFVNLPENRRLRLGTGNYSTPFRGTLFKETESAKISDLLRQKSVDILWMGSNPNVEESLEAILGKKDGDDEMKSFIRQRDCGMYSQQDWVGDHSAPAWSPFHSLDGSRKKARRGWQIGRRIAEEIGDIDSVSMANFMAWGSKKFSEYEALGDSLLLHRILDFSAQLHAEIVNALKPKLIVIPFSLGRNKAINVEHHGLIGIKKSSTVFTVNPDKSGRKFNFYLDERRVGVEVMRVLHMPHPSALALNEVMEKRVIEAIAHSVGKLR